VGSANIRICTKTGLIPSRGFAPDHTVDHSCPSKHQKTSAGVSLNAPLRPPFRRCLCRGRPLDPGNQSFVSFRSSRPSLRERVFAMK
jgi:hypothetical protein